MGSKSNYLENKVLDHVLKTASFTVPSNLYMALFTATPSDAGGGTECSGGDYARVQCNAWDAASGGATANTSAITFPTPSAGWGTVVAWGLFDASSGGNLLYWGALAVNKTINTGDAVEFAAGAVDITED